MSVSTHPPHENVDRVDPPPVIGRHVPYLFVRFSFVFVAFGQSVHFIFNINSDALLSAIIPNDNVDYIINFRKFPAIHTNYITPQSTTL